ncbi:MAG: serine/threonine-protein kinase, partial [Planctomycetota bacterium]
MTDTSDDQIRTIFEEALDVPTHERSRFLASRCDGDERLRAEVESLLRHASSDGMVSETSAPTDAFGPAVGGSGTGVPVDAGDPEEVAGYKIVRKLGQGGMGVVYRAVQGAPRRTVALKLIRQHLVNERAVQRFRIETEALARLQHPGIAQLYEAGVATLPTGEQPYFAMEYIKGRPLMKFVSANGLDITQRLQLFTRITEAVHHAHSRGVVHRDLKPANVLVTDDGQPKIVDFGVARLADVELDVTRAVTEAGQLIGTLPYMSPEQVGGDPDAIDTRTDVYSLGVMLYELLAGRLPYDISRKALAEAVRVIQEVLPESLSSISRVYRGDVETIVAKALAKEPERRYASASELASDIGRYLNNEPISARPPSAAYQVVKFAKRHRAMTVAAGAVAAGLVLGGAGLGVGFVRASQAAHAERIAREDAELRLDQLEKFADTVQEFESRIERQTGGTLAQQVFASTLSGVLDRVTASAETEARLGPRFAEAALSVGRLALEAGTTDDAIESFATASDIAQRLESAGIDASASRLLRARAAAGQAEALVRSGDGPRALDTL